MVCHICKEEIDLPKHRFTQTHLKPIHKISPKEYYDTYLKKSGDGICKHQDCSNVTEFNDLNAGYRDYCCRKCMQTSDTRQEKRKLSCIETYGVDSPMKTQEIKNKLKASMMEAYGVTSPAKLDIVKTKMKSTMITRYGVDHPMHSEIIKQKLIDTNTLKYGTECVFSSDTIKAKIVESNNLKFGTDYPLQNKDIQNKAKETSLKLYGTEHPSQSIEIKDKAKATVLTRYGVNGTNADPSIYKKFVTTQRANYWSIFLVKMTQKKLIPQFDESYYSDITAVNFDFKCTLCNKILSSQETNPIRILCTCQTYRSKFEEEIAEFLDKKFKITNIVKNKKYKNRESDIMLPDFKLGIDFHGLYWHNNLLKDRLHHQEKLEHFNSLGYDFMQIFETEWVNKRELIENIISKRLGITSTIIYARKCDIREIDKKTHDLFIESNHIQGTAQTSVRYGLYHNNELISVMSFSKSRFSKKHEWELVRFANKMGMTVTGGASKLLKAFERNNNPKSLVSYCDVRLFNGTMYTSLGFIKTHRSAPDYFYFKKNSNILEHRTIYQKHKLESKLPIFDKDKTEYQNMLDNGYLRIFDAGNDVYEIIYSK